MNLNHLFIFLTVIVFCSCKTPSKTFLFAGSYTGGEKAEGIYVFEFDDSTGELKQIEKEGNLINPSFLTLSPDGNFLYACTESKLKKHGSVSAFKIDTLSGKISFINKQSSGGRNPAHVTSDKSGRFVICSNFTDSSIGIFKTKNDGSLEPLSEIFEFEEGSIVPGRQAKSHLHSANLSPDNQFVFAPDLGSDKIRVFDLDSENLLTENHDLTIETKKGNGPRHFTFHPNEKFAYCLDEISGTVSSYSYQNGQLTLIDNDFSYQEKREKYGSADIHVSPDGKFLYASNRVTENTISIFSIDSITGELTLAGHQSTHGKMPRSFVISPSGEYLIVANRQSNNIVVFKRNLKTGLLTKVNFEVQMSEPSSLKMRTYFYK